MLLARSGSSAKRAAFPERDGRRAVSLAAVWPRSPRSRHPLPLLVLCRFRNNLDLFFVESFYLPFMMLFVNPLRIGPLLDTSLTMTSSKRLLLLNYRHNPNITETKLQKLKHSESESFFSVKAFFSGFDWIQIIVAVAGARRNPLEPSHAQIPPQI